MLPEFYSIDLKYSRRIFGVWDRDYGPSSYDFNAAILYPEKAPGSTWINLKHELDSNGLSIKCAKWY